MLELLAGSGFKVMSIHTGLIFFGVDRHQKRCRHGILRHPDERMCHHDTEKNADKAEKFEFS